MTSKDLLRLSNAPISALVALASDWSPFKFCVALRDHGDILLRITSGNDRVQLTSLFERCSVNTRNSRFLAPLKSLPEPYLTQALDRTTGRLDAVGLSENSVIAFASSVPIDSHTNEIGILIQDSVQRLGLGTLLLEVLIDHARENGVDALFATIASGQAWILRELSRYGRTTSITSHGVIEVTLMSIVNGTQRPSETDQ